MIKWAFLLMSRLSSNRMLAFSQTVHFLEQGGRVDHHPVPDNTLLAFVQNSRGDQVQDELFRADHDRMARVMAALVARNNVRPLRQQVNDLSFSFIAPLGADDD